MNFLISNFEMVLLLKTRTLRLISITIQTSGVSEGAKPIQSGDSQYNEPSTVCPGEAVFAGYHGKRVETFLSAALCEDLVS